MCIWDLAVAKLYRVEMVCMSVGDQKVFYFVRLDVVYQKMVIGVGTKIYKKIIVYYCLASGSYVLSAEPSCFVAILAVAEHSGKAFSRSCSQICQFHFFSLKLNVNIAGGVVGNVEIVIGAVSVKAFDRILLKALDQNVVDRFFK
jgi:hypothetical protein